MESYVQIGIAVMRDTVTGEPLKPRIPLYARSKAPPQASGITRGEEKLLTDVAGVFVDIFRRYNDELKKNQKYGGHTKMNNKKLYKVTITDENGKVMHEVESDCIIAAISDPSRSTEDSKATHAVYMTNCPMVTITGAFEALGKVKREAIAKNPMLGVALAMESLSGLAKKYGVNLDEEDEDISEEMSQKSTGGGSV